jgi:hypothetical protein
MESSILSDFSQIIFFVNPEAAGRISLEPKKVEIPRIAAVMGRPDLSRAGAVFKTVFFAKTSPSTLNNVIMRRSGLSVFALATSLPE